MASFLRVIVLSWAFTVAWFTLWMLMLYLTNEMKLKFTDAAAVVNVFAGVSAIGHLGMQFLVDAFIGHFWMLCLSTLAFGFGFGFLAISASPILSGNGQKGLFYVALTVISVGIFGRSISLGVFTEDQLEDGRNKGSPAKLVSFVIGNVGNFVFLLLAASAMPQISPWFVRFAIPAGCEVLAMLIFMSGARSYKREIPSRSPLTTVLRVFVASASKMSCAYPNNSTHLYEKTECDLDIKPHTSSLRCLDRAAMILQTEPLEQQRKNRWKLCRVTEVEQTKSVIRAVPLFVTSLISGIVFSLGNTFFLEQANNMDSTFGSWNLPLPLLLLFSEAARLGSRELCVKAAKRSHGIDPESAKQTKTPYGIPVSIILSTFCCSIAAHVESRRLKVVSIQGLVSETIPMSVFWLLPQYILLGSITGIYENSFALYLEETVPDELSQYMVLLNVGVCGVGIMSNIALVSVVGRVSGGKWFQETINKSRLDYYYWVLTVLCMFNLLLYFSVTYRYTRCYKKDGAEQENVR
ncbi:PREDICTED: protein NRT1/ PTR FAMILY 5.5-like [Camelina sativa]|uniref:Protein NRT1/ PTR FAMILY 5.5-like n=1 Tax=Camelina sativa TaxID=90675 RepID=A0ABM0YSZ4_CAMSA|nr:PREDICTED: protein NRT1/ PTR FAMILY 5.5-like [Camelina sativa]XP_010505422.1 PREDICTED: protein NRT1/ PTR FAMILY 5.5-like [Camelina sativa]